jgi:hypothetical protein
MSGRELLRATSSPPTLALTSAETVFDLAHLTSMLVAAIRIGLRRLSRSPFGSRIVSRGRHCCRTHRSSGTSAVDFAHIVGSR